MDEMKINSKFTRMLLSKLAKGVLHKKLGYNVDIQLNELNASISDEIGRASCRERVCLYV